MGWKGGWGDKTHQHKPDIHGEEIPRDLLPKPSDTAKTPKPRKSLHRRFGVRRQPEPASCSSVSGPHREFASPCSSRPVALQHRTRYIMSKHVDQPSSDRSLNRAACTGCALSYRYLTSAKVRRGIAHDLGAGEALKRPGRLNVSGWTAPAAKLKTARVPRLAWKSAVLGLGFRGLGV